MHNFTNAIILQAIFSSITKNWHVVVANLTFNCSVVKKAVLKVVLKIYEQVCSVFSYIPSSMEH